MMEGNYGDTSPTPRGSPHIVFLLPRACAAALHSSTVTTGGAPPLNGFLTHLSIGWGRCTGRMHWVCGQWSHGERRRGGWLCFGIEHRGPFSFFPPSFLWFYGLLTGSRLSSGYERGISGRSVAEILTRGLQEERQQGSCAGPDGSGGHATSGVI